MGSSLSHYAVMAPSPPNLIMPIRASSSLADLPPDILISILGRLGVADRIRFGSVCSSFKSAFRAQLNLPDPPSSAPWMLLPDECTTSADTVFFSVADDRVYRIPQREPRVEHRRHCMYFGCSDGWLVTLDRGYSQLYLLNPLIGTKIHLPPLPSFKLLSLKFCKAVLSSTDKGYTVVLLLSRSPLLSSSMICIRQGKRAWTPFGKREIYSDAAIRNGYLYAMQSTGTVEAWDLAGPTLVTTIFAPESVGFASFTKYLVSSDNSLLQVWRSREFSEVEFKIFKLDLGREQWVEAKSLDGRVIFLNRCCSMSLYSGDCPEFGTNSIYFDRLASPKRTDAELRTSCTNLDSTNCSKTRECMVFRMEDNSVERILCHRWIWEHSPIWIAPSLV